MLEPKQGACDQETLHLAPAEIVDESVPVVVKAFAWIEVLIERAPVEAREAVRVGRKMRRHPIENNTDAGCVRGVNETREALGRTETAARREQAQRLIAPRSAERIFGDGKKL